MTGYQWQESQNGGTTFNNLANGLIFSDVTTSSLTVTGATAAMNGYQYRCIVSGACAPAVNSSSAILTVTTAPIVTAHPSSTSICPSGTAFFTVAASGTSVTYRWQESTGGAFTNVTNGGVYGGSTTATLTITGAPIAMNTYQYRCVVTDVCTQTSTSNNATLTVNATPAITTQPVNSTLCGGNNTTFSVVVTGSGLTYQWQVNQGNGFTNLVTNGVYTGATTATLTITGATEGMNGYTYRCVTTGTCDPSVTSNTVTLTVNVAPTITAHPSSTTICTGENSSHAITATGTALTYQWQESTGGAFTNITNGGVYGGATSSTLTLTGATTGMNNYQYRCVVSGTCTPSVTSNVATLAVNAAPVLTQHPANSSICINGNATITILTTGTVASYQWQESQNGGTTFSDLTNGGVYGGVTTASLIITGAPSAMNDYRYRCVVAGGSGTCATTLTSNAATLSVGADPVITSQPTNTSAAPNTSATFIVSTAGVGITYQWQEQRINGGFLNIANGGIYSGVTTAVLTINPVASGMHNYQYRCIVTNSCGISANSNAAILTVPTSGGGANITGQPSDKDVCEGSSATFSVTVENGASYSYQWQEIINDSVYKWITDGGIYSGAATTTLRIANTTTSMNNNKYRCDVGGSFSEKAKLAVSTAPAITAQPANTTVCSGSPTSFSIAAAGSGLAYQWQESQDGGASFHNVTNGGIFSGTALTTLNISNVPSWMSNWRYRSIASRSSCSSVSTSAVVTVYTMPDTGVTVFGQNLFSKASGCTYQWLDCTNSFSPLAGQTNKSFVAMQSGSYAVELTKNGCKDTSACYSIIVAGVADENAHRSHISLYPNPTRGSIMVDAGETITAISVTNALGQTIFSTRVALPEPIEVSLHDAPPGIYFFRIETRTGEHFEHVVKQ